jgi:hypothetical protein
MATTPPLHAACARSLAQLLQNGRLTGEYALECDGFVRWLSPDRLFSARWMADPRHPVAMERGQQLVAPHCFHRHCAPATLSTLPALRHARHASSCASCQRSSWHWHIKSSAVVVCISPLSTVTSMSGAQNQEVAAEEGMQSGERSGFASARRAVETGNSARGGPAYCQGRAQNAAKPRRQDGQRRVYAS